MDVERRDHDHRDQRSDAATTFRYVEAPITGDRANGSSNRVNGDAGEMTENLDHGDNQKLQFECHLLDRAEWNHEKEQTDREEKDARDLFAPEKKNGAEREKWKPEDGDPRLQGARTNHVKEDPNREKNQSEIASLLGRRANFIAMVPDQPDHDQWDQFAVFLIVLRKKTHPGPRPDWLGPIGVER